MDQSSSEKIWEELKHEFRQACMMRLEGREDEASQVMNQQLPAKISAWGNSLVEVDEENKRAELEELFANEIRRTEDAWVVCELFSRRLARDVVADLRVEMKDLREESEALRAEIAEAGNRIRKQIELQEQWNGYLRKLLEKRSVARAVQARKKPAPKKKASRQSRLARLASQLAEG